MFKHRLKSMSPKEMMVFMVEEPMLSYFFVRSNVVESNDFPAIAGVGVRKGKIKLFINPDMMKELTPEEKIGVMVHEYLHVLMLHCTKRMNHKSGAKSIKENIATDMAINQLIRVTYKLPSGAIYHDNDPWNFPANLTAEQYFELIDDKMSDEEVEDKFGDYMMDSHDLWAEATATDKAAIKEIAKSYAQRKSDKGAALSAPGNVYGNLLEALLAIEVNDISWISESKYFMQQLVSEERTRTYKRPSRRYGFPEKGSTFERKAKVAAIVDTSGSMSSDFLSYIGGHLNQMALIMEVDVIMCDTDIQGDVIKRYRPSAQLEFPGRGGTRLAPAFEYAGENHYKGVICFTDGGVFNKDIEDIRQYELPTLWVIVNNERFVAPFGRQCNVNWTDKG